MLTETTLPHSNPIPQNFEVVAVNTPGHAYVKQSEQTDTKVYLVRYRRAHALPPDEWQVHVSERAKNIIQGLKSQTEYLFSFASFNCDESIHWSPAVSYKVQ